MSGAVEAPSAPGSAPKVAPIGYKSWTIADLKKISRVSAMTPLEPMYLVEFDRNQAMMTSGSSTHSDTSPISSRGAALLSRCKHPLWQRHTHVERLRTIWVPVFLVILP